MKTILIFLTVSFMISATELHVNKSENNLVKFISDAPVEDFEGVTNNIDGYLYWEGEEITNNSKLYFEVDLNTIDTGIGLRNRHMRDNYLETNKYRFAKFTGKIVNAEKLDERNHNVEVEGEMDIHGVKKMMYIKGLLKKKGNSYRIITDFEVNLKDHNIEVPSFMFLKIDEVMELQLDFILEEGG